MELFPTLGLGWLNGWLPLAILYALFGLLLLIFPRDVVQRLYDRSGWTRADHIRRAIAFPFSLAAIALFVFLPLKLGTPIFWIGLVVYVLGLIFFFVGLFTYRHTPLDQPVTGGIYRWSRNPQVVGLILAFLGVAVAAGSWSMVAWIALMAAGSHLRILAEERGCLAQYGEPYQRYLATSPRYFLFF